MAKTHFSLNRRANLVFIASWGVAASLLLILARPRPVLAALIGAVCGLVAGLLQRASIRLNPGSFSQAKTGLEVRRLFMTNRPGKLSIALMWVSFIILVIIGFTGPGRYAVVVGTGYISFLFLRDLVAFSAIHGVEGVVQSGHHAF